MQDFKRIFRVWDACVGHDQLLVRSAKGDSHPSNIDLIFTGVKYIGIPTILRGLRIDAPTGDDCKTAEAALNKPIAPNHIHVLESGGHRHVIVALGMKVDENELDLFESSLDHFNDPDA
jgi:hypothetical protein